MGTVNEGKMNALKWGARNGRSQKSEQDNGESQFLTNLDDRFLWMSLNRNFWAAEGLLQASFFVVSRSTFFGVRIP